MYSITNEEEDRLRESRENHANCQYHKRDTTCMEIHVLYPLTYIRMHTNIHIICIHTNIHIRMYAYIHHI